MLRTNVLRFGLPLASPGCVPAVIARFYCTPQPPKDPIAPLAQESVIVQQTDEKTAPVHGIPPTSTVSAKNAKTEPVSAKQLLARVEARSTAKGSSLGKSKKDAREHKMKSVKPDSALPVEKKEKKGRAVVSAEQLDELFPRLVLYEDDYMLAINKPAGVPTVPDTTKAADIVTAALRYVSNPENRKNTGKQNENSTEASEPPAPTRSLRRVWPIHRIDRPVSGVVCLAKTKTTVDHLTELFKNREVKRTYMGVVNGHMDGEGMWYGWLVKNPGKNVMEVVANGSTPQELYTNMTKIEPPPAPITRQRNDLHKPETGKETNNDDSAMSDDDVITEKSENKTPKTAKTPKEKSIWKAGAVAVTHWRALRHLKLRNGNLQTLVVLEPKTGRLHQIRAQAADAGHAVVGDTKYGAFQKLQDSSIALHASSLALEIPAIGKEEKKSLTFEAPLPESWMKRFGLKTEDAPKGQKRAGQRKTQQHEKRGGKPVGKHRRY